jgi:ABC-type transport system involved in multi-copper enzyme maturation permease subunit
MSETEAVAARPLAEAQRSQATAVTVCAWELRRLLARRSTLVAALVLALFFVSIVLIKHQWTLPLDPASPQSVSILGSTAFGQVYEMVGVLLLFLGMVVPFLTTDAVARDRKQRVHELLMATPLRTSAYVWGRYLAVLLVALLAAALMAVATVLTNVVLHAAQGSYPMPSLVSWLPSWLVLVVTAVVFVGSIAFALGTLLPRWAMAVKVAVLLAWVMLSLVVGISALPDALDYWMPTASGPLKHLMPGNLFNGALIDRYAQIAGTADTAAKSQLALRMQTAQLDLGAWLAPRGGLLLIGVAAVALAAATFHRFRSDLN